MSKWLLFIFFFFVLLPSISHAGISSLHKSTGVCVGHSLHVINAATNEDVSGPAIEIYGPAALPVIINHPVSHNTNCSQDYNDSQVAFHAPYLLSGCFIPVEMFGNNRLSYNYPSHNFW